MKMMRQCFFRALAKLRAAPRYIEARLSKLANEVIFNPKTTTWAASYDGRNKEPVTLPVKFPLLLVHGAEGIAVGLACKILPHNFNELIDACIAAFASPMAKRRGWIWPAPQSITPP